jgi:protein translocase SecG subunit
MVILSIITIVAITLQPSQKTGLMGDATDIEKREKRGAELFLFRSTIILIILFLGTAIAYGAAISGLI